MLIAQAEVAIGQIFTVTLTLAGALVLGWQALRSAVRDKLVTSLQADVVSLSNRVAAVEAEKEAMRKNHEREMDEVRAVVRKQDLKINAMTQRMMYLESEQGHSPFPEWEMDEDECYATCNEPFTDRFLRPLGMEKEDVIGRTHEQVFGNSIVAKQLKELDLVAKDKKNGMAWATGVLFRDGWPPYTVGKGVLKLGRRKIGMRGIAYSADDMIVLKATQP